MAKQLRQVNNNVTGGKVKQVEAYLDSLKVGDKFSFSTRSGFLAAGHRFWFGTYAGKNAFGRHVLNSVSGHKVQVPSAERIAQVGDVRY